MTFKRGWNIALICTSLLYAGCGDFMLRDTITLSEEYQIIREYSYNHFLGIEFSERVKVQQGLIMTKEECSREYHGCQEELDRLEQEMELFRKNQR